MPPSARPASPAQPLPSAAPLAPTRALAIEVVEVVITWDLGLNFLAGGQKKVFDPMSGAITLVKYRQIPGDYW